MSPADKGSAGATSGKSRDRATEKSADHTPGEARDDSRSSEEPRGIEKDIADADKEARTGSKHEPVRNTPPAGPWNDTAAD